MAITRMTQNMLATRSLESLQGGISRLAKAQEQLSTGRVINRASDSPTDAGAAMRYRVGVAEQKQYVRNGENSLGWLGSADSTLQSMQDGVRQAGELALQGASTGTSPPAARAALAAQVDSLRDDLIAQANTTYLGRPLFGGVTGAATAFDTTTGAFTGTPGAINRTVADGVRVRIDITGTDVVGPNGNSLFDDLTALSTALRNGDETGIRAGIDAMATRRAALSTSLAGVGAVTNRIEAAVQKGKDQELALTTSLSEVEDTDIPKATIDLKLQEVAYQAALAATQRVIQPSLVDFLR